MTNVVNKANFTNYPKVLEMIGRCERLYEDVSQRLVQDGKQGLYEDERLFINMISRLNEQVLDTADGAVATERKEVRRVAHVPIAISAQAPESEAVITLRSIVEENDARANATVAATAGETGDIPEEERKRPAATDSSERAKRTRFADDTE